MTRVGWLLTTLLGVLLIVAWYFLIFTPTQDDIADVRAEREGVEAQTEVELARLAELRSIREQAPEAEAQLALGRSLIPDEPSMPALFRQLQQAADDSGATLTSIVPSAPSVTELEGVTFATIGVSMTLEASYFQLIDLARRIEDPALASRALRWDSATVSPLDSPQLAISLSGQVFSRTTSDLPTPEEPEPVEEDPELDDEDQDEELDDGADQDEGNS